MRRLLALVVVAVQRLRAIMIIRIYITGAVILSSGVVCLFVGGLLLQINGCFGADADSRPYWGNVWAGVVGNGLALVVTIT
jgi:hypothetical protein